jgi:release factor glutamine methyltransferase
VTELVTRLRAAGCVFAEDEARLLEAAAGTPEDLEQLVARRVSGVPLEHLLGWVEFCGRRIFVAEGVFVPRRRTELLARAAAGAARPGAVVVELCCGAAAVATVLADRVPGAEVHAADISAAAVACARRNLGARVYEGDLYAALPSLLRGRIDVLVANAPYVPTAELAGLPAEARLHEPRTALDGGPDGLDLLRRVISGASAWLAAHGQLLVESSARQADAVAALMHGVGLGARVVTEDDATVVAGRRVAARRTAAVNRPQRPATGAGTG